MARTLYECPLAATLIKTVALMEATTGQRYLADQSYVAKFRAEILKVEEIDRTSLRSKHEMAASSQR